MKRTTFALVLLAAAAAAQGSTQGGDSGLPDLSGDKLRPRGITAKAERSIQRGLQYLARTQNRDGSWRSAGGYGSYPVAMTALAAGRKSLSRMVSAGTQQTTGYEAAS